MFDCTYGLRAKAICVLHLLSCVAACYIVVVVVVFVNDYNKAHCVKCIADCTVVSRTNDENVLNLFH